MVFFKILVYFSTISFLYYGFTCLFSEKMASEFKRFGVSSSQRKITGVLQVAGATGLIIGLTFPLLGFIAASGLTVLMLLGFIVRIKLRDDLFKSLPSFIYMVLNLYLANSFYLIL